MNKGVGIALLLATAGLLGTLAGYLGGAPSSPNTASAGTSPPPPSKTARVATAPGSTRTQQDDSSTVNLKFIDWMRSASEQALRAQVLEHLEGTSKKVGFRSAVLLRELLRRDAQGTFDYFLTQHENGTYLMSGLFEVWSAADPIQSTQTLVEHTFKTRTWDLSSSARTCFDALAREDLQSALDLAERLSQAGRGHAEAYTGILRGYATTAPPDMEQLINTVVERGIDPSKALGPWAEADPEGAIAWLRRHGDERPVAASYIAQGIGRRDPRRGLELCREFDQLPQPGRGSFADTLLSDWMEQDYDAAVDWLEGNTDAGQKELLLEKAMRGLANSRPTLVLDRILAGDPIATRHGSLTAVINALGRSGNDNAVFGILERAPDDMKEDVRKALMETGHMAPTDDYLTQTLAAIDGDNNVTRNRALQNIIQHHPERLPGMLSRVPPDHRAWFLDKFASKINRSDPGALLSAAAEIDDPTIHAGRGIQQAIATIGLSNPKLAMEAVEAIPVGMGRAVGIETVVRNLMPDDPDTALEWLETQRGSGIPAERYLQLLSDYRRSSPLQARQIDAMLMRANHAEAE